MVVSKGYFCPRIFSQPGMREWVIAAGASHGSPLSTEMRQLVNDLPNHVGTQFNPVIFEQHPEMHGAVDEVVDYALSNGDGDLVVRFNELSWQARLFHDSRKSVRSGASEGGIQLHLRYAPCLENPASLNEFFRAVLATNPRFRGSLSNIDPHDTTPYFIVTPRRSLTLTLPELIASAVVQEKLTSPNAALRHLFTMAGIDDVTGAAMCRQWDHARDAQEARYFASMPRQVSRPGISLWYRISECVSPNHMDRFTLAVSHRGSIIVDGEQLEGLTDDARSMMAVSAALWRYAYDTSNHEQTATRFMLSVAEQEGRLGDLIDIFVLRYPHLFVRFVSPLESCRTGSLSLTSCASWDESIVKLYVKRFEHQAALAAGYRIGARPAASTDLRYHKVLINRLITDVMPRALQRAIGQMYVDTRVEIVRMILEGKTREEIWNSVDDALEGHAGSVDAIADDIRRRYVDGLEAGNLLDEEMLNVLNHSLDNTIEDERARLERSLDEILSRVGQETGVWRAAHKRGAERMVRGTQIAFWQDVKKFVENDQQFSAFRYDVMAQVLGWTPLNELPAHYRDFMRIARECVLDLYGGKLPDKSSNGKHLKIDAPFRLFVERNELDLNGVYAPYVFLSDVEALLGLTLADSVMTSRGPLLVKDSFEHLMRKMLKWRDSAELPVHVRPLLRSVRSSALSNFGGRLPSFHPLAQNVLKKTPLSPFIEQGTVRIKAGFTLQKFRNLVVSVVSLRRRGGRVEGGELSPDFERAFSRFVAGHENWASLSRVPSRNWGLIKMLRKHLIEHFGGRLPAKNPITGARMRIPTVERFIRDGELRLSDSYGGKKFFRDLQMIFSLQYDGVGYVDAVDLPEGLSREFASVMGQAQGWTPLARVASGSQEMLGILRNKILQVFWGRLPSSHPVTEKSVFPETFRRFVCEGVLLLSAGYTIRDFRRDLKMTLSFSRNGSVITDRSELPDTFDDVYVDCIAAVLGWENLESLPKRRRTLARMARKKIIGLYYGVLPDNHPVTGATLRSKVLREFVVTGNVDSLNSSERDFYRILSSVMRIGKDDDEFTLDAYASPTFDAAYEAFVTDVYGWVSLDNLPEGKRALVASLRDVLKAHFRWRVPRNHPVTNASMTNSALIELVAKGKYFYNPSCTTQNLKDAVLSIECLELKDGQLILSDTIPPEFDESYERFIHAALRWMPIDKIEPCRRHLVEGLREHVLSTYGGRYPAVHPFLDMQIDRTNVQEVLESGGVDSRAMFVPESLRKSMVSVLTIGRDEHGKLVQRPVPEWFADAFAEYFGASENRVVLDQVPVHAQPLVSFMRDHVDRFFGGVLPSKHPLARNRLDQTPVAGFLNSGQIVFHAAYGPVAVRDGLLSLYNLERREDQSIKPGRRSVVEFDRAYQQFIAHELDWSSLDEVAEHKRDLLRVVRREMVKLFGGHFRKKHPLYGNELYKNPIRQFVITGDVRLRPGYNVDAFLADLEKYVLGVVRTKKGYKRRSLPEHMVKVMNLFRGAEL